MFHEDRLPNFTAISREEWRKLRADLPLGLTEKEWKRVQSLNDRLSLQEAEEVYLPLSRLLNILAAGKRQTREQLDRFLGKRMPEAPFVIGIAGSVAVGKSTAARIIQALLEQWPDHPRVELVTTDGFLFPNKVLEQKGLMGRKGFPESYDVRRLIRFLEEVKSGKPEVSVPVYSHLAYDIVPGETQTVRKPDILILEGLNILQTTGGKTRRLVSDFIDFSIYVDAEEQYIRRWYVERFQMVRQTAFQHPSSYFRRYIRLTPQEAERIAIEIWERINAVNLKENILPTRERADLILEKGENHFVRRIYWRKF